MTSWIVKHDDSKVFIILYISLAVILSAFISLFWLLAVVAVHFAFELIKQKHHVKSWRKSFYLSLWEIKLDFVLLLFAVWLTVYMNFIFGVVGIGVASRAIAQGGSRFLVWQRVIRGILISLDDAVQVARFGIKKKENNTEEAKVAKTISVSLGDIIVLGFLGVFIFFITLAPYFTEHTYSSLWQVILEEFKPIP